MIQRSCAQIQQLVPNAKSGYYWIYIKRKRAQVYCDMDNYGRDVFLGFNYKLWSKGMKGSNPCNVSFMRMLKFVVI